MNTKFRSCNFNPRLLIFLLLYLSSPGLTTAAEPTHLRLIDDLDRPVDGYCIDVHGTPGSLRTDLPLFAHNCKSRLTVDSAVVFESTGPIQFIELGLCVTVAGVNSQALPGTAVILRKCGESTAFMETESLQQFNLRVDGKLELDQSGLCLTVGSRSAATYSSNDRWRSLFVDDCDTVDANRSRWEFSAP